MGAVLICNLDGSSCSQFLGGESTIASAKSLKLQPGDKFGTSITVTASSIFVGTASKTGGSGEVYKFDLSGKSGETIDIADLFQEKQYFGKTCIDAQSNNDHSTLLNLVGQEIPSQFVSARRQ